MRIKIYNFLVNRHSGICRRYHKIHDNSGRFVKIVSWLYLFLLNFAYYFLHFHFLDNEPELSIYEVKKLKNNEPESWKADDPSDFAEHLAQYDIISFDIFDTLIYRPFSAPTDLFYLVGIELELMDFVSIRCEAEAIARKIKYTEEKHYEVTLEDIWKIVELKTGIKAEIGMMTEMKLEKKFCYSNEYMLEVYKILKNNNKKIIFTSDMYLPSEVILEILNQNGYKTENLFLSCELKKSKSIGDIYTWIKNTLGENKSYIHIGDNQVSDVSKAKQAGFAVSPVMNPNKNNDLFRANDMSPIIGGAYRGIVNNRLNNGMRQYNQYFEFGFIYGGIFVLGYCNFIYNYCKKNQIDKVFFLARDGEIIKKAYDILYPGEETKYILFSRVSACKLTAEYNKNDYLKKMVYHKVNKGYSFQDVLKPMELEELIDSVNSSKMNLQEKLTSENIQIFIDFIYNNWDKILSIYQPQRESARTYFSQFVNDNERIAVVDIGWAGTGAIAIRNLIKKEWKYNAEVLGIVAGTNTFHNAEPYTSEGFLLNESIVSYMYSSSLNRDLWKKHNCSQGHNLFWELLVSSESPSFLGFYPNTQENTYQLKFLETEKNSESISYIQQGILTFIKDYISAFGDYNYMLNISGRDAYAPMLSAMSYDNKFLREIYKNFELKVEVGQ